MTVAVPSLTLASRLSPYPLGEQLAALCRSPSECWPISSFWQGTDLGSDLLMLPVSPRLSPHLDFTLHSLPSPGTVLPATTLPLGPCLLTFAPLLPMSYFLCLKAILATRLILFFTYPFFTPVLAFSSLPPGSSLLPDPPPSSFLLSVTSAPFATSPNHPLSFLLFTLTTGHLSTTKSLNSMKPHTLFFN